MKKFFAIILVITLILSLSACGERQKSSDEKQAEKTEQMMDRANSKLGLPNIKNWLEKRLVKELYEKRDQEDLVTYTYTYNEMTGEMRFLGKSLGFGIPASVQYSNPERLVRMRPANRQDGTMHWSDVILPQAEPNGLFMPEGLSATYVFLMDPLTKEARPTYVEPSITVSMFPLPNAVYPKGGPQYKDLIGNIKQ